jgi:hypothetical protein
MNTQKIKASKKRKVREGFNGVNFSSPLRIFPSSKNVYCILIYTINSVCFFILSSSIYLLSLSLCLYLDSLLTVFRGHFKKMSVLFPTNRPQMSPHVCV